MAEPACPHCGHAIPAPLSAHGGSGMPMHSHIDCPKCERPLTYFTEGVLAGEWRPDDVAEAERQRSSE